MRVAVLRRVTVLWTALPPLPARFPSPESEIEMLLPPVPFHQIHPSSLLAALERFSHSPRTWNALNLLCQTHPDLNIVASHMISLWSELDVGKGKEPSLDDDDDDDDVMLWS